MVSNEPQGVIGEGYSSCELGKGLVCLRNSKEARGQNRANGTECEMMRSREGRGPDAVGGWGTSEAMVRT